MANIKLVKLMSGLEMVGECVTDSKVVELTKAFQVVVQPVNEKQFSIGLAPLSAAVEDADKGLNVMRPWSDVLGVYLPTKALIEAYCRLTGTIITTLLPRRVASNVISITEDSLGG